jgi:4-diphosphocytidyl-2C-methyl-D-erythritol kinase
VRRDANHLAAGPEAKQDAAHLGASQVIFVADENELIRGIGEHIEDVLDDHPTVR